jgi:uncharacterized membrane protein
MTTRLSLAIGSLMTLACGLYSAYVWPMLPDRVPTHWNMQGHADAFGPKITNVVLLPMIMLVFVGLMIALPAISPEKFKIDSFRGTFNYLMLLVLGLMGSIHVMILQATLHGTFNLERGFMVVFFLFWSLFGNVTGKIRRNFWMGVRTPWTLADERVWDQTHRSAARLWTIGGAFGVILSLISIPAWALFTYLMVICLWPAAQSYLIYQRLNRSGLEAVNGK